MKLATILLFAGSLYAETAIRSLSVPNARPGTVLTAEPVEFPGFSANPYVYFVFPDSVAVPVPAQLDQNGQLSFPVPYFIDPEVSEGYRSGECQVALPVNGRPVGAVRFHIDPLLPVANAPQRLRELIETWSAGSREQLALQRGMAGAEAAVDIIRGLSQKREQALIDLAARIEKDGAARLPFDLKSPKEGDDFEVSARHIEHLVSMILDLPVPADNPKTLFQSPRATSAASGPACIADAFGPHPNQWDWCLDIVPPLTAGSVNVAPPGLALIRLLSSAIVHGTPRTLSTAASPPAGACTLAPERLSPALIAAHLLNIIHEPYLLCKLYPVKPVSIRAVPSPDPIPIGSASSVGNKGTELRLRTEPWWTPEFAVDKFLKRAYDFALMDALPLGSECGLQVRGDFDRLGERMFQSARGEMLTALQSVQSSQPPFREVPVYKCDISELFPEDLSGLNRNPSLDTEGPPPAWGLEGIRAGSYRVRFSPIYSQWPAARGFLSGAFIFADETPGNPCGSPPALKFSLQLKEEFRPLPRCVSVTVAGGETAVRIESAYVFSYRDEGPKSPVTYNPPRSIDTFLTLEENSNGAKSFAQITKVNDNNWQITQQITGAPASEKLTTTWNRLDFRLIHIPGPRKIRVKFEAKVTGTCQSIEIRLGQTSRLLDRSNDCSGSFTLEEFSPPGGGNASTFFQLRTVVLGGEGLGRGPGAGQVTTNIEFLQDTP
ncbi:MAG: hypothetical protein U0R19_16805 [Bryobacteraceae bacterium]